MLNGLYSGAAALDVLAQQQELIANNLMHVNTVGHRRIQAAVTQRFELDNANASLDLGPEISGYQRDFQPGRFVETGRPLDLAIAGDGFFVFQREEGELLSRNGRLFRNPQNNLLVNEEGNPIQGVGGPITIDTSIGDQDISIAPDGTISARGQDLGKLRIVAFTDNQTLTPEGSTGFRRGEGSLEIEGNGQIVQFRHELSNVQPVTQLVALIVNNRQHEAVQKATRTISEALSEYIRA